MHRPRAGAGRGRVYIYGRRIYSIRIKITKEKHAENRYSSARGALLIPGLFYKEAGAGAGRPA